MGNRQHFSCETALLKFCNDILWSMETQSVTAILAVDLSAAFYTVHHDVLLNVMEHRFGIKSNV